MIPADHITIDGDTAWLVFGDDDNERMFLPAEWATDLDRPCDTCDGHPPEWDHYGKCPDCIDGRHTFEIDVQTCDVYDCAACIGDGPGSHHRQRTHRVSIVPGMVLPIYGEGDNHDGDLPHVCHSDGYLFPMPNGDDTVQGFPMPAAKPDMAAVQLKVAR